MHARTVIVTGASAGLGKGTCEVFAEAGWNVVLAARGAEGIETLAHELAQHGGESLAVPTDVSDPDAVDALVAKSAERFGKIDLLINNAGIDFPGPIDALSVAQFDRIIKVNLNGVFYACKAVFPIMRTQGGGTIFNISSVAGRRGAPGATGYCASKFALTGLSQALSFEGKPHRIRVSVIYPGGMDTGWSGEERPDFIQPRDAGRFLLHTADQPQDFVLNEAVMSPLSEQHFP
ncbi:SDR family oxidoreductase [Profundibacterium mesophilum]|uniref:3-oxoacyl-acyl-carrier protein reductase n=1 Tax=Profundibacterium mesophilum KAUST100406-0324 TaxID=1037889 RepID=A0A921NT89_9RHOB|nr:SDR family oxidoreductase [Profundibacterium mesophilum]KAF0675115.1 3-oxoacyl-acyl-carrier protein reductase [Profundibacterium mesophilum KAUST100406-0324]